MSFEGFEKYSRVVKFLSIKYARTPEEREDLEQEGWVGLFNRYERIACLADESAQKLAYKISRDSMVDYLRQNWRDNAAASLSDPKIKTWLDDKEISGVDELQEVDRLVQEIDKLPGELGEIIRHRFGIDRPRETLEETAERFGLTLKMVRNREEKALEILKERLCH